MQLFIPTDVGQPFQNILLDVALFQRFHTAFRAREALKGDLSAKAKSDRSVGSKHSLVLAGKSIQDCSGIYS
jgi:hypothetical protein